MVQSVKACQASAGIQIFSTRRRTEWSSNAGRSAFDAGKQGDIGALSRGNDVPGDRIRRARTYPAGSRGGVEITGIGQRGRLDPSIRKIDKDGGPADRSVGGDRGGAMRVDFSPSQPELRTPCRHLGFGNAADGTMGRRARVKLARPSAARQSCADNED